MIRVEAGAFVTFIAANGARYVRIINLSMKAAASQMSETEKRFDYVEHALVGLRSVTYYGNVRERRKGWKHRETDPVRQPSARGLVREQHSLRSSWS